MPIVLDTMLELSPGYNHMLYYQITETFSWPWPYPTNCRTYSKGNGGDRSWNECVFHCTQSFLRQNLSAKCLPPYLMGTKEKFIEERGRSFEMCEEVNTSSMCKTDKDCTILIKMFLYCTKVKCQESCHQMTYHHLLKKEFIDSDSDYTLVTISPKFDSSIIHSFEPAVSTQKLFADLGGLGGLYIGFNILAAYRSIVCIISEDKCKF